MRKKGELCAIRYGTAEVPNFGPHVNIAGSILAGSVASLDEWCAKIEQNRICRSKVYLQFILFIFL
jgi:hypothetical protein